MFMLAALAVIGLSAGGCTILGFFAAAVPRSVDAEYKGLAGEKVAVMVWADRGLRIDFEHLQLDTANAIQSNLLAKTNESSLKNTTFPWEPRSVVRFQKEHPEFEGMSVTEYAHRISGITRLIFVEVGYFSTRSGTAVQLMRGEMMVNVKVLEVKPGKSTVIYEKQNLQVSFPERSPEGVLDVPEAVIYNGTIKAMARSIAELFYPHVIED